MTDYRVYKLNVREWICVAGAAMMIAGAVGFLFFQHAAFAALIAFSGLLCPRLYGDYRKRQRQRTLSLQFQQMLHSLSSSLASGKSVESALQDALQDLRYLYPEPDAMIVREVELMLQKLANGGTVEKALLSFAERSGIEDVDDFAEVFAIGKRQGGNLVEVVRKCANMIAEKLEMQRDIATVTAQKKWEARILGIAPIAFIGFLNVTSRDYMAPLFSGAGRLLMVGALVLLTGCWWLCMKITDIRL